MIDNIGYNTLSYFQPNYSDATKLQNNIAGIGAIETNEESSLKSSYKYATDETYGYMNGLKSGAPHATFQDTEAFLSLYEDSPPIENVMTLTKKEQAEIDKLEAQLEKIFGVPKEKLSADELKREKKLVDEIDAILKQVEPPAFSAAQEKQYNSIIEQLEALHSKASLTADEEKKITALQARLDNLIEKQTPNQLSAKDEKKLDKLFSQLDELYGVKKPSDADLAKSEEIFKKLDGIYNAAAQRSGNIDIPETARQRELNGTFNDIQTEIGNFLTASSSPEDQRKIEGIEKEIDAILGYKPISDAQAKRAEEIDNQINKIFKDGRVTPEEEKTLTKLEKQLEDIFGSPKDLNQAEEKKLDELFGKLNQIYDAYSHNPQELDYGKLTELSGKLDMFSQ